MKEQNANLAMDGHGKRPNTPKPLPSIADGAGGKPATPKLAPNAPVVTPKPSSAEIK